jgi:hypothetical protein
MVLRTGCLIVLRSQTAVPPGGTAIEVHGRSGGFAPDAHTGRGGAMPEFLGLTRRTGGNPRCSLAGTRRSPQVRRWLRRERDEARPRVSAPTRDLSGRSGACPEAISAGRRPASIGSPRCLAAVSVHPPSLPPELTPGPSATRRGQAQSDLAALSPRTRSGSFVPLRDCLTQPSGSQGPKCATAASAIDSLAWTPPWPKAPPAGGRRGQKSHHDQLWPPVRRSYRDSAGPGAARDRNENPASAEPGATPVYGGGRRVNAIR